MNKEEYKPEQAKQYANRHNRFENDVCSVEYIKTTPEIVEKLLDGNLRNRRLNAGHMKKLSIDIKNGRYVFAVDCAVPIQYLVPYIEIYIFHIIALLIGFALQRYGNIFTIPNI
jgi:hypothetical protein